LEGFHAALWYSQPTKHIFSDCLKWLYDKLGCLRLPNQRE